MEVAVFISGVADPKWPLPPEVTLPSLQAHGAQRGVTSPFDEAALELALSLRDRDPQARVTALVASDEALARRIAGWRPDALHRIDVAALDRWDGNQVATALGQALAALAPDADLVLIGREFGDFDDGVVAPALARRAGLPFLSLALGIGPVAGGLSVLRQGSGGLERAHVPARAIASVTNDPGNRLRHPLMKNVMLAKKMPIPGWQAPAPAAADALRLADLRPAPAPVRTGSCSWLEGSAQDKAAALARVLAEAAA